MSRHGKSRRKATTSDRLAGARSSRPGPQGKDNSQRHDSVSEVRSPPSPKRAVLRAVVVFVVLIGLFYGFVRTPTSHGEQFRPYLKVIAATTGGVLELLGYDITVIDTTVDSPQFSMEIVQGCDAIEPIALFAAAVVASPVSLGAKIPGILLGWICLLLINLLRLVSLFIIGISFPALFDVMHEHIWQAVFVVLAIVFWAIWVQWATRPDRGTSHATG